MEEEYWVKAKTLLEMGHAPEGITREHVEEMFEKSPRRTWRDSFPTRRFITKAKFDLLVRHGIPLLVSDFHGVLRRDPDTVFGRIEKEYGGICSVC